MIAIDLRDRTNAAVSQQLATARLAGYHQVLNGPGAGFFQLHRSDPAVAALNVLQGGIDGYLVHLRRMGNFEPSFVDRFTFVVEPIAGGVDDQEDDGSWITIGGRGSLCLLEDRMAMPPGWNDAVNPPTKTGEWQIYAAQTGGVIMAAEIDRSAARFAIALTHTVDTSTVQQTVKLRFDNLLKLHEYFAANGLEAQMVGLDYQAADRIGVDKSATVKVQLSQQDALLNLQFQRDSRPVKNYVVAEGTGEGINAKLAVAKDNASIAAYRRREGFLSASEIDVQTQLNLRASSAVSQLKDADNRINVKFSDKENCQLYRDVSLGDTVTLAAVPLSWSAPYRVVGIQVADTESEIEDVSLDLNDMRTEMLIRLAAGTALNSDQLSVINRMPQGAPYNDSQGYPDNCSPSFPFHFDQFIPSNTLKLNYGKLSFKLRAFRSPVSGVASTTTTGGTSHSHSTPNHTHLLGTDIGVAGAGTGLRSWRFTGVTLNIEPTAGGSTMSTDTSGGGSTSGSDTAHTHDVTPTLIYGIFESTTATGVLVIINGVDRTAALGGGAGFGADQTELEVSQYLNIGAWNTVDLQPSNLGRIVGHLRLTGYIQSN